jgi:hypothetical protein
MKKYKTVSDGELIGQIRIDARSERHAGLAVIHQLKEVSRRRLYATLGFRSLHQYCMEDLKFSAGSAVRRIAAMEALEDLPELEEKVASGELNLTNISQVQSFCDRENKSVDEKKGILEQCSGLSKRETEQKLAEIAPKPKKKDKRREIDGESTELRITIDRETMATLEKIKDLISHSKASASWSDVVARIAKIAVAKLDPAREPVRRAARKKGAEKTLANGPGETGKAKSPGIVPPVEKSATTPRIAPVSIGDRTPPVSDAIPAANHRAVWQRDGGKCTYVAPHTGRRCDSTQHVQCDPIIPRAIGGTHEVSNLRLRCCAHNLLAAIEAFGLSHMQPYLNRRA